VIIRAQANPLSIHFEHQEVDVILPSTRSGTRPLVAVLVVVACLAVPSVSTADPTGPTVEGPIPGAVPGNPASPVLDETYPFFSTWHDLAATGYVEEEFYLSGVADAYATSGARLASDVPY
jgi:hypothetical protein